MDVSKETPEQTRLRLSQVLARAKIKIYKEDYVFEEFAKRSFPLRAKPEALAFIRDGEVWSQLVPSKDTARERFRIFKFSFKKGLDNSGFIGWLGSHLKRKTGTGVFVICGQNSGRGGIYDYWGCPIEIAELVLEEITSLREKYAE